MGVPAPGAFEETGRRPMMDICLIRPAFRSIMTGWAVTRKTSVKSHRPSLSIFNCILCRLDVPALQYALSYKVFQ